MTFRLSLARALTTIAKNKAIAAALVSLFVAFGAISAEDVGAWTDLTVAFAALAGAVL